MDTKNSKLRTAAKKAIIQTLLYSDIFSFPLTKKELWYFLKSNKKISNKIFSESLKELQQRQQIIHKTFYLLPDRDALVSLRKKRSHISTRKLVMAKKMSSLLKRIPTVLCIGVSGSLAAMNATEEDDIDFFLIAKSETIWITRLFVLGILEISGKRRRKTDNISTDKYCANMLLTENALTLPPHRRDIYTAHEIAQLLPLINKQHTYENFLAANAWIRNFLPNVPIPPLQKKKITIVTRWAIKIMQLFDPLARSVQHRSIEKTRTSETVTASVLAFHPQDHRLSILQSYQKRTKNLKTVD